MKKILSNVNLPSRMRRQQGLYVIYSAEDFYEIIERERARADRSNQCFSLVVFDVDLSDMDSTKPEHVVSVLASRMRISDEIGWFDKRRIGMILPDTLEEGAWKLADEVCQEINGKSPTSFCTVYAYPSEKWPVESG